MDAVRKGLKWSGDDRPVADRPPQRADPSSFALSSEAIGDPVSWALGVLDLRDGTAARGRCASRCSGPSATQLRDAHPDHGANDDGAAQRIAELTEARRILLG